MLGSGAPFSQGCARESGASIAASAPLAPVRMAVMQIRAMGVGVGLRGVVMLVRVRVVRQPLRVLVGVVAVVVPVRVAMCHGRV